MSEAIPVYFPFTFLEPCKVERIYGLVGRFRSYRAFEKKVSEEVESKEVEGKVFPDIFRVSSPDALKIARRFLDWSSERGSLDLKALSAFFRYIKEDDESENIISSIMNDGDNKDDEADALQPLLKHEITLFLLQLQDRQEYEINSALDRISQGHKKLFQRLDTGNVSEAEELMPVRDDFRLKNMETRISSWLAAFFFLSGSERTIFTDEKEAFLSFLELFRDDEIRIFRANKSEDCLSSKEFVRIASDFSYDSNFAHDHHGYVETGKPSFIEDGDMFFAAPGLLGINRVVAGILGLKGALEAEKYMLSASYGQLSVCMVA